jgi:predicted lipid-binding transport protein (Tim44 family)
MKAGRVDSWFGGLLSLIPIGLFEKFVGIEKSFGVVDFLTIIIMTLIVSSILERGDRDKASKKSASSPATTQRLSSDSGSTESANPIRGIDRYSTDNPSTSSSVSSSTREKLEELKSLLDDSLINEEDYEKKKNDLLRKM